MKGLGSTAKGGANAVKDTVSEYKGWLILLIAAYLLYKFNGLFTGLGDAAKAQVDAATAESTAKAQAATAAAEAKRTASVAKAKVSAVAPSASDADVARYQADAESIASSLGTTKGVWTMRDFWKDESAAFSKLKNEYSRLLLSNNYPWELATKKSQRAETAGSAKRRTNYKVLVPFYHDITGGRDLVADIKSACSSSKYQPTIKWVL
jgi:hypothetical protein